MIKGVSCARVKGVLTRWFNRSIGGTPQEVQSFRQWKQRSAKTDEKGKLVRVFENVKTGMHVRVRDIVYQPHLGEAEIGISVIDGKSQKAQHEYRKGIAGL